MPADFDIVDPGVRRKPQQLLPRLESTTRRRLVDKEGLPPADEQTTRGIDPHRQKRLVRRRIEPFEADRRISNGIIRGCETMPGL